MGSHVIDSELFKDQFGTQEMRKIFSDESILQKWLDVEAALAQAEAEIGLIPKTAAEEIKRKAQVENMDFTTIRKEMKATAHPLVPVIRALESICDGDAGGYVHWGATTQDITDTALILQIKEAREILLKQLQLILKLTLNLAKKYRNTIMPGRTHGQHALPITFGYKVAIWADEIGRHMVRLKELKRRLTGQFGGAAGTLASLDKHGLEVQERMMRILGLEVPTTTWHVARDNLAEFAMVVGMVAATIGKIANEIINLQRTEIGEVEEGFTMGKVGSSTMPHKRNPMICENIVGLSRIVRQQTVLALECMVQEHERDMGLWQVEWLYLPEICILTSSSLAQMQRVLQDLIVHEEKMKHNVNLTKGLIVSENVMLGLAKHVGRQAAHDLVYRSSMKAFEKGSSLVESLLSDPEVMSHMSESEVIKLVQPENYVGISSQFVDRVLKKWRSFLPNEEEGETK